jgi:hypothetical protein
MEIDVDRPSGFLITQLNVAWAFGILYFVLGFIEAPIEYFRFRGDALVVSPSIYIALKVILVISFIFFQRGFILIGELFNNYLLKIISLVTMGAYLLLIAFDVVSLFSDSMDHNMILFPASLLFGAIGFIYGIALRRMEKRVGKVAEIAGLFEILAACFYLTMVLGFIGEIVQVPAALLEIIIIFKVIAIVKTKQTEGMLAG